MILRGHARRSRRMAAGSTLVRTELLRRMPSTNSGIRTASSSISQRMDGTARSDSCGKRKRSDTRGCSDLRIIDLSLPLYTGMPVYPGDPEASIERIQTITERGWELRRIQLISHHGTHVNVPSHGIAGGKTLDEYSLSDFCGRARIHQPHARMSPAEGILFRDETIDDRIAEEIKRVRPRFIGLSCSYDLDARIEKDLLAAGIISFENLANLNELPESFVFYGMPLRIRGGDGSPVRAFAVVEASI